MIEINFVTSNKNKVREFKGIIGENAVLNHIALEYPEMRSDDPGEISRLAAKQLAEKLQKTVICEDSGLFIKSLKGFPGTCSKYIHQRIGLQGILKLMEGIKDRSCEYISAVGYCEPGTSHWCLSALSRARSEKKLKGNMASGTIRYLFMKARKKHMARMRKLRSTRNSGEGLWKSCWDFSGTNWTLHRNI
ncbi:non-canonical purine NTP pyrophosphatase [Candidatus Woesearchaeota archaeon]|nr:non-canonical purine NTP pyrophosphatase [Candidatus Woesearchaeota archaeon]